MRRADVSLQRVYTTAWRRRFIHHKTDIAAFESILERAEFELDAGRFAWEKLLALDGRLEDVDSELSTRVDAFCDMEENQDKSWVGQTDAFLADSVRLRLEVSQALAQLEESLDVNLTVVEEGCGSVAQVVVPDDLVSSVELHLDNVQSILKTLPELVHDDGEADDISDGHDLDLEEEHTINRRD